MEREFEMGSLLRYIVIALILPIIALTILALDAYGAERTRHSYRISMEARGGGPVRSALVVDLPAALVVRSSVVLGAEQQERLAWHYRNAALQAERFATRQGATIMRRGIPNRVEVFDSPRSLAEATMMPASEYGWEVVARVDLRDGVVYLGRQTVEDLYVELGKWFLYPADYRWGQDRERDLALLKQAETFARFCMDKKNWIEAGGDTKSLW